METVKMWGTGSALAMSDHRPTPSSTPSGILPPRAASLASPLAPPAVTRANAAPTPPPVPPLTLVLNELVTAVEGVNGALLASVDGFAISRSSEMPNSAAHAALLAAGMGLAHQLAGMGGGEQLRQLVVDHDAGLLLLWPIGTQRVLALLTARRVDQAHLRHFVQSKATWLAGEPS